MTKFNELRYELLEHPPYSPDVAPSDYYLFSNLKQLVREGVLRRMKKLLQPQTGILVELPESHYRDDIKLLEDYWNKCIEVKGDYIE